MEKSVLDPRRKVRQIVEQLTDGHGPLRWTGPGTIQEELNCEIAEWTETAPIEWIEILIALADENPDQFRYEIVNGETAIKADDVNFVDPILVKLVEVWSRKDPAYVTEQLGKALLKFDCISGDFLIEALGAVCDRDTDCMPWIRLLFGQRNGFSTAEIASLAPLLNFIGSDESIEMLKRLRVMTPIIMTEAHEFIDEVLPRNGRSG